MSIKDNPFADEFDDEGFDDTTSESGAAEEAEPEPEFTSVYEFVETHFGYLYQRQWKGLEKRRVWCPRWHEHAEAVSRLEALWRAYESLRLDPQTGMSVWWRDHVDPHMGVLTDPDGPFSGCTVDRGHQPLSTPMVLEEMVDLDLRYAMSTQEQ